MKALRIALVFVFLAAVVGVAAVVWHDGALPPWLGGRPVTTSSPTTSAPAPPSAPGVAGSASTRSAPEGAHEADLAQLRVPSANLDVRARAFYEKRGYRVAWLDGSGRLNAAGQAMAVAVSHASEEGLEAADYDLASIDPSLAAVADAPAAPPAQAGEPGAGSPPGGGSQPAGERLPGDPASLDGSLTMVFLRYASDVATGRVDPRAIHEDWHLPPNAVDVVAALGDALEGNRVEDAIRQLPPPHPEYARLRQALAALRAQPAAPDAQEAGRERAATGATQGGAHPASSRSRAKRTARRPAPSTRPAPPPIPVAERIRRVVLSMERWRWVPRELEDPAIVIDLPAFQLDVRENGQSVLAMRIVAGKSFSPTPLFRDEITSILFHPAWNIPETIAREEILPAALRDPDYLRRKRIRALSNYEESARAISPARLRASRDAGKLPFVFRQEPGPENPLGRIKFVMPNKYDIYLHDTPSGHLFAREERAFSHGCVRLEKPAELAEYLLRGTEWDRLRIDSAMDREQDTQEVRLPRPMPVLILYMTAWTDGQGEIRFGEDIYGLDAQLEEMLDRARAERTEAARSRP